VLLLVDECLPRVLVDELRTRGHDVMWVRDSFSGADDVSVLSKANSQGRVVLSEDRDFGDLTMQQGYPAVGIVRVRMSGFPHSAAQISVRVATEIENLGPQLIGQLTVIEPGRVRQRALPGERA
jgi:predicted nuclease of predicted toxin-antitoxin system